MAYRVQCEVPLEPGYERSLPHLLAKDPERPKHSERPQNTAELSKLALDACQKPF